MGLFVFSAKALIRVMEAGTLNKNKIWCCCLSKITSLVGFSRCVPFFIFIKGQSPPNHICTRKKLFCIQSHQSPNCIHWSAFFRN